MECTDGAAGCVLKFKNTNSTNSYREHEGQMKTEKVLLVIFFVFVSKVLFFDEGLKKKKKCIII